MQPSCMHLKSGKDQSEAAYESWRSSGRRRGMELPFLDLAKTSVSSFF